MVLSKGAEPPGANGLVAPSIWGVGGVYSRGSSDRAGVMGCVACGVRTGLGTGTGWGARWRMRGRGQGNSMNSVLQKGFGLSSSPGLCGKG